MWWAVGIGLPVIVVAYVRMQLRIDRLEQRIRRHDRMIYGRGEDEL